MWSECLVWPITEPGKGVEEVKVSFEILACCTACLEGNESEIQNSLRRP